MEVTFMKYYPLDLARVVYMPKRKLYLITVILPEEPRAIAAVVEKLNEANIEILTVYGYAFMRKKVGHLSLIVDLTESSFTIEKLIDGLEKMPEVLSVEYVEPEEPGLIIDKYHFPILYGAGRAVLFDIGTLSAMFEEMRKQWGSAGEALIYYLGYAAGRNYAKHIMERYEELSMRQLSLILRDIGQAYGWAILDTEIREEEIVVKAKELFECKPIEGMRSKPYSQFFRGYISGAASEILGKEMIAEEVKCISKGDEHCEFVIKEKK